MLLIVTTIQLHTSMHLTLCKRITHYCVIKNLNLPKNERFSISIDNLEMFLVRTVKTDYTCDHSDQWLKWLFRPMNGLPFRDC